MAHLSESSSPDRLGIVLILAGFLAWLPVMIWSYSRVSLWLVDVIVVPVTWSLSIAGIGCMLAGVIRLHQIAVTLTVVPVMVAVTIIVGAWLPLSPRVWFVSHRFLYERALSVDPGNDYYGRQLPAYLRFLSAGGQVSGRGAIRFFPQWIGTPDDAGGYLHSPGQSPDGFDMYGMACTDPAELGDDWWMCGMKS